VEEVKCAPLPSISTTLRIIRDIANRVPTWRPLTVWAMELLAERTLSSVPVALSPGEAVKRVFEVVAGGLIINKNFTMIDPCEKETVEVMRNLSVQEREDITSSAQHALRLIRFNQIWKILGIERISATDDIPSEAVTTGVDPIIIGDRKRARESEGETNEDPDAEEAKKPKVDAAEGSESK